MSQAPSNQGQAHDPCPICLRPRNTPCGRSECPLRECLTAGIPDGLTETGKVDTKTQEWEQ
jgi:hypothetical protein